MASFIKSATSYNSWINDSKKEICFVGRSNVGKSSLINSLANEQISKTSNTPGRTQTINFFDFGSFRLIDLPGYGYASVSKSKRIELLNIIDEYLINRKNLVCVFQICDINIITEKDLEMSKFLNKNFDNYFVLLNKMDKYSKSHFDNNKAKISKFLDVDVNRLIPISAKEKTNIKKIFEIIKTIIN